MESTITVIDSQDTEAWFRVINALPKRFQEVFLFPGYARLFEALYQAKASLFHYAQGQDYAIHVLLRRPINTLPFFSLHDETQELFDMITPEYSGPVIVCREERMRDFTKEFWRAFNEFALREGIVAEFGRISPYYNCEPEILELLDARPNRQIVAVDLTLDENKIMKGFSKGNRSSIKKAQRLGVTVEKADPRASLQDFHSLYTMTMQRNSAIKFYCFPLSFFENLFTCLRDNASLFITKLGDKTIAASIFLHHNRYIHYYFSGSDTNSFAVCPNNLLLYEAIRWARTQGFEIFSLGGGYHNSGKDSLFAFKSSFSSATLPFYTYQRVHNNELYQKLCEEFLAFNKSKNQVAGETAYFPAYRG